MVCIDCGEPLRDGAAHAVVRHDLVAALFEQRADLLSDIDGRDWRAPQPPARRRAAVTALAGFRAFDVARDDAAVRARALDARQMSMPASLASRLASGEAKTRPPDGDGCERRAVWRGGGAAAGAAFGASALGAAACGCGSRRRGLRLWRGPPLARAGGGRFDVLALAGQHRDHLVDRHVGGAFRHHDLGDGALVDRLDLHRRLVGLDLGDDVAGFDLVALLLQPLGKVALLHRGRQRRHEDVDRHERFSAVRHELIALVVPGSVGAPISAANVARIRTVRLLAQARLLCA